MFAFRLVSGNLLCLSSLSETILKLSRESLLVPHTSSTFGATTLSLGKILPLHLGERKITTRAFFLLNVVRDLSTATARGVCLVTPLSETSCSLCLSCKNTK